MEDEIRSSWSLLFRLDNSNSLSLSTQESVSIPLIILMGSSGLFHCSSCAGDLRPGSSTQGGDLTKLDYGDRITLLDLLAMLILIQPSIQLALIFFQILNSQINNSALELQALNIDYSQKVTTKCICFCLTVLSVFEKKRTDGMTRNGCAQEYLQWDHICFGRQRQGHPSGPDRGLKFHCCIQVLRFWAERT